MFIYNGYIQPIIYMKEDNMPSDVLCLNDEMATNILNSIENPPAPSDYLLMAKSLYETDVNI